MVPLKHTPSRVLLRFHDLALYELICDYSIYRWICPAVCESAPDTFEPVIVDPLLSDNPYRREMIIIASTSDGNKSIKSKIALLVDRQHWLKAQLNGQVVGNTGRLWKVCTAR